MMKALYYIGLFYFIEIHKIIKILIYLLFYILIYAIIQI